MPFAQAFARLNAAVALPLDALQPVAALAARLYVGWQFLKAGWLKLADWETTLFLFQEEYHAPLLSPALAAMAGTAGELLFPVLLIAGVAARVGALGLFAVNALAVLSYAHVLLAEGFEAALAQHVLWGVLLAALAIYGPGRLSVDALLEASARTRATGR